MEAINFFKGIAGLDITDDLNLTISMDGDSLIVSLLSSSEQCGDNAKKGIPRLSSKDRHRK